MRKHLFHACVVAVAVSLIAACGGGGGGGDGWNGGSESNPTFTAVNAAGNAVTSISPNMPIIANATGLLRAGVYNVAVVDPNGSALYTENLKLVTDGSGNLADTVLAYLGNDTQNQASAMVIDTATSGFRKVAVNYKAITPGVYKAYVCKESEDTCDANTASATLSITVDGDLPYVFSADSTGAGINSFENGKGDVYGVVNGSTASTTIDLYVTANSFQVLSNGDPLPTAIATATCTTDANGDCGPQLLWTDATATLTDQAAMYDIIADVNRNGIWDEGTDIIDAAGYIAGFAVQEAASAAATSVSASTGVGKVSASGQNRLVQIACALDGSGYCRHRDVFSGLDIYGYLNPYAQTIDPHVLAYKFIILHDSNLSNGDTLTPIQSLGYTVLVDPLQWGCTNEMRILLWPYKSGDNILHVPGCYDVVLDVNKNLIYDEGVDFLDGRAEDAVAGECGFVIPGVEGAPSVSIVAIEDGNGAEVEAGGTTTTSTARLKFTANSDTGVNACQVTWASGNSSNTASIPIDTMVPGEEFFSQYINLFGGTNTVVISCSNNVGAGSANVSINSTNTATQNIHFQTSLTWTRPESGSFDMDLHLIERGGAGPNSNDDCYYANCKEADGGNTNIGAILNVDCISQCTGPENIWIPNSNPLSTNGYDVCVLPFSGEGRNLQVEIFDNTGTSVNTVTIDRLNQTLGRWYVGSFNCTSGSCSWGTVNDVATSGVCY